MTLRHAKVSTKPDPADPTHIGASDWNADHTQSAAGLLGRETGAGATQVLSAEQARSFLGVADGATANATDAALRDRATHTGTQSLDTTTDSATRLAMTPAERTKLSGVATGATANATDAALRDRATHTGTQAASTISDFAAQVRAQVEAALLAGANVTITPAGSGATRTLSLAAAAGGGGGGITDAPSDGTDYARRDGAWFALPKFLTLVKTADESRSANTFLADAQLQATLEANSIYRFELMLQFSGGTAEDFRFRVQRTGLSDADLRYAGDLDNNSAPTLTWGSTTNCAVAAAGAHYIGNYIGNIVTGANTGTIILEWAQQTAGATAAILRAGSMMMLRKVA